MIPEEKQTLRASVRGKVLSMPAWERASKSAKISDLLAGGLGMEPGIVLAFAPMRTEPQWFGARMGEWEIYLPKVVGRGAMEFYRLTAWEALVAGPNGNREPAGSGAARADRGDVAIVPGMAFDAGGGRLGRGGGFYDRFLAEFRGRKIGVCFSCQMAKSVPMEAHDAGVDVIVTEDGWFEARSSAGRPG